MSTLEVMPTILDVLGIEANPEVRGRSLGALVNGSWPGYAGVFMGAGIEKLRTPRWSLMVAPNGRR